MKKLIAGIALALSTTTAQAYFEATGPIEAQVCKGFGIRSCSKVSADAVEKDGRLYELSRTYREVTEYRSGDNRCWIRLKSTNVVGNLISRTMSPQFYTLKSGEYKEIDPEYLTFKCRKMR